MTGLAPHELQHPARLEAAPVGISPTHPFEGSAPFDAGKGKAPPVTKPQEIGPALGLERADPRQHHAAEKIERLPRARTREIDRPAAYEDLPAPEIAA